MKKTVLSLVLVFSLIFGSAAIVMADTGFHIDLGYEELNNSLAANTVVDHLNLGVSINTPCPMYTVDCGYDFNDNFAVNGTFAWGSNDLASANAPPIISESIDIPFSQDNQFWQVEATYKTPVSTKN